MNYLVFILLVLVYTKSRIYLPKNPGQQGRVGFLGGEGGGGGGEGEQCCQAGSHPPWHRAFSGQRLSLLVS